MKILFAKPGECLRCEDCFSRIEERDIADMAENHDCEDYWCALCRDYRGVVVTKEKQ